MLGNENQPSVPETPASHYHEGETNDNIIIGDLNHDSCVNIYDFCLLKKEMLQPSMNRQDRRRADTDADGDIDAEDVVAIQKWLTKQDSFKAVQERRSFQYAIDMTWSEGVYENTNKVFKEEAYVNLDNKTGNFLEWTVNVPEDGNYLCTFSTANGSKSNRQMKIEVNQGKNFWMQDFLPTGAWSTWQESSIVLPLKQGRNTIRLTSATTEGGPNFDYLKTEWTDEPIAEIYQ